MFLAHCRWAHLVEEQGAAPWRALQVGRVDIPLTFSRQNQPTHPLNQQEQQQPKHNPTYFPKTKPNQQNRCHVLVSKVAKKITRGMSWG